MSERHLPDWDENTLSLGKPDCMDTPTLIEWIQCQLETEEETAARHNLLSHMHQEWHASNPGIWACCINSGPSMLLTVNERLMHSTSNRELEELTLKAFRSYSEGKTMILPEGMSVTPLRRPPPNLSSHFMY